MSQDEDYTAHSEDDTEDHHDLIARKDEEIRLAARLGEALLVKNQQQKLEIEGLHVEVDSLHVEIESVMRQLSDQQAKYDNILMRNGILGSQIDRLESENTALRRQLSDRDTERAVYEAEIKKLKGTIETNRTEYEQTIREQEVRMTTQLEELRKSNHRVTQDRMDYVARQLDLEKQLEKAHGEINVLKSITLNSSTARRLYEQRISRLNSTIEEIEDENSQLSTELQQITKSIQEMIQNAIEKGFISDVVSGMDFKRLTIDDVEKIVQEFVARAEEVNTKYQLLAQVKSGQLIQELETPTTSRLDESSSAILQPAPSNTPFVSPYMKPSQPPPSFVSISKSSLIPSGLMAVAHSSPISPRVLEIPKNDQEGPRPRSIFLPEPESMLATSFSEPSMDQKVIVVDTRMRSERFNEGMSISNPIPESLVITVSNPKKHGQGSTASYSFKIQTHQSETRSRPGSMPSVRRKYRDFQVLRRILLRETNGEPVPIIKEEPEDPNEACVVLGEYMNQISQAPILTQTECFSIFLSLPYGTWTSYALESENRNRNSFLSVEAFETRMKNSGVPETGIEKTPREAVAGIRQKDDEIEILRTSYTEYVQKLTTSQNAEDDIKKRIEEKGTQDEESLAKIEELRKEQAEHQEKLDQISEELELAKHDMDSYVAWLNSDPIQETKEQALCIEHYIQQLADRFFVILKLKTLTFIRGDRRAKKIFAFGDDIRKFANQSLVSLREFIKSLTDLRNYQIAQFQEEQRICVGEIEKAGASCVSQLAEKRAGEGSIKEAQSFVQDIAQRVANLKIFTRLSLDELHGSFIDIIEEKVQEAYKKNISLGGQSKLKASEVNIIAKEMTVMIRARSELQIACF